jgi:hypothetical protein
MLSSLSSGLKCHQVFTAPAAQAYRALLFMAVTQVATLALQVVCQAAAQSQAMQSTVGLLDQLQQ